MKTPRKQKIDKVLVPLDFSRASLKAIDYALALGSRFGAKLHFVHVLDYDYPPPTLAMMGVVIPDVETGRNAKRRLKDIAKKYAIDLPAENLNVVTGRAYHEICQLARQLEVDLIAISTRGHTSLKRLFLGSTAERVVQHATCPVLVVRERERDFLRGDGKSDRGIQLKKILVPLDFSACSLVGVEFAVRFASHWDAQLVLFHAVPIHAFVPYGDYGGRELPDITGYAQDVAKQEMEQLISRLRTRGIKVEAAVELGSAAQEVCDYAREHDVDLIITSTHGSTGLKHVLIGSIAEHIVRYAYCPVLVVSNQKRGRVSP
jgi:nucleotide-binding universal stress UspA family protein